ncbi:zinc finger protein ZAT5-like protein [Tanacetum coccineum]
MDTLIPKQTTIKANAISVGSSGEDRSRKDQATIIKRKRTKRPRPAIVTHSSTSYNAINSSPSSSSNFLATSTTTEDEDTANCLILLSKGHDIVSSTKNTNDVSFDPKFNSKKYIQTSTNDPGMYVYECKTCSRTFPSFQALGGHRASHNKPRNNELETKKPRYNPSSDEDEPQPPQQLPSRKNNSSSSSSISIQLNYTNPLSKSTNKAFSKIHECSICGSEFNSGQALGGHMRRHRATPTAPDVTVVTDTNTTLSLVPYNAVTTMVVDDQDNIKSRNDGLFFDLDLNLPAPSETVVAISDHDQLRGSLQPVAHLSATPTLVDCHY